MPIYEYYCDECGCFESQLRSVAEYASGFGCPNCGAEMRRLLTAPAVLNRKKPGSFRFDPKRMNPWDDRVAHLRDLESKGTPQDLRKFKQEMGSTLWNGTLAHKKENYA